MADVPLLFVDAGSPVVSVALGAGGAVATRTIALRRSSERMLTAIEEVLAERGCGRRELGGIVVLQGPGSFTGLRVGLATVLGLHQALGVPATALPTLPVLAAAAGGGGRVTAAVDALRGDWYAQTFEVDDHGLPRPVDEPGLRPAAALLAGEGRLIGFGVGELTAENAVAERLEPPPLAPVALARWGRETIDWDPEKLTAPIYFRPPAVTLPASLPGRGAGAKI